MAVTVLTNAYVEVNSVDISSAVHSVSIPMSIEDLDITAMGDDTIIHEPGRKDISGWEFDLYNDFTDDALDEDLYTLWSNRTKFSVAVRPSATAVGAGNPSLEITGYISDWKPMSQSHGEVAGGTMTVFNTTSLTRATS